MNAKVVSWRHCKRVYWRPINQDAYATNDNISHPHNIFWWFFSRLFHFWWRILNRFNVSFLRCFFVSFLCARTTVGWRDEENKKNPITVCSIRSNNTAPQPWIKCKRESNETFHAQYNHNKMVIYESVSEMKEWRRWPLYYQWDADKRAGNHVERVVLKCLPERYV